MASASRRNPVRSMLEESSQRPRRRFQLVAEVFSELSKVTWPTRQEATRLTILVVIVAVTMGIILGLWDFGFNQLANRYLF